MSTSITRQVAIGRELSVKRVRDADLMCSKERGS